VALAIHMIDGETINTDGQFNIDPGNGVLTVVCKTNVFTTATTHYSPGAWRSVEQTVIEHRLEYHDKLHRRSPR
jgi:hypothetical protein